MNHIKTWLSSASTVLHEAELVAKGGTPEAVSIALNLMRDATQMVDLCLAKRIPVTSPECHGCPHHEPVETTAAKITGDAEG